MVNVVDDFVLIGGGILNIGREHVVRVGMSGEEKVGFVVFFEAVQVAHCSTPPWVKPSMPYREKMASPRDMVFQTYSRG